MSEFSTIFVTGLLSGIVLSNLYLSYFLLSIFLGGYLQYKFNMVQNTKNLVYANVCKRYRNNISQLNEYSLNVKSYILDKINTIGDKISWDNKETNTEDTSSEKFMEGVITKSVSSDKLSELINQSDTCEINSNTTSQEELNTADDLSEIKKKKESIIEEKLDKESLENEFENLDFMSSFTDDLNNTITNNSDLKLKSEEIDNSNMTSLGI